MRDKLEIVVSFEADDNGDPHPRNVSWQWRHGRCTKNGIAETPSQAVRNALAARAEYEKALA